MDLADLDELMARTEITDVLLRYVRGADRADWDLVRSCYHPDATDDHGLYRGDVDGLIGFLTALAGALDSTSHHLSPPLIVVDGDDARSEAYCIGSYTRSRRGGGTTLVCQGVRYLDRLERRSGRWAISTRVVVHDWERVFIDGESAPPDSWQRGARGSDDPSSTFM
ncbi:MAG: nuclear transport factor 2 family protein [Ilumatobacter sp.]|uniref:nuclear transport factor 2 family protein n=1 Tax=Ilumatobacter sp. TaxID=1967498 RepID=UPI003918D52C